MCVCISLTIIKCNVLTCFDNCKITGAFRPKVVHCDFAIGALRLGLGHSVLFNRLSIGCGTTPRRLSRDFAGF